MTNGPGSAARRVLSPIERIAEILFGLIMVLTFTGSLSVADAGRDDVRAMLVGALGCNLAWGIIDALFYLMNCLAERGEGLATYRAVLAARGPRQAGRLVADALPPVVARVLEPAELAAIQERLKRLPQPEGRARLGADDWRGAAGVLLLVFLTTLPVAIPFMVMQQLQPAMRVSNAIAMALLFALGCAYGRITGYRPWLVGLFMVVIGAILVAITIALGG